MIFPVRQWLLWYSAQAHGNKTDYGYHDGEDINLKTGGNTDEGQDILAIADGVVSSVHIHTNSNNFGKHIHIAHEGLWGKVWCHFAHCSDILVKEGDTVKEGQVVAKVGRTGAVYSHLHWAIKLEPTGLDGIAKTLEDLKKWTAPIPFVEKYMKILSPQPTTDVPQTLQKYGKGSLSDLSSYIDLLREDSTNLVEQKRLAGERKEFIDKIAQQLNCSSEYAVITTEIEKLLKVEDSSEKAIGELEETIKEKDIKIGELNRKLKELELRLDQMEEDHKKQIDIMRNEITQATTQKSQAETQKKQLNFLQYILKGIQSFQKGKK